MSETLAMFRKNNDTLQIAAALGISEAEAYNRLQAEREDERQPAPKLKRRPVNPVWREQKKAEYAGKERAPKLNPEERERLSRVQENRRRRERLSALRHAAVLP